MKTTKSPATFKTDMATKRNTTDTFQSDRFPKDNFAKENSPKKYAEKRNFSRPKPELKKHVTLYVGNLSYERTELSIKKLLSEYGCVFKVKLMKDGEESKSLGYAFVVMHDNVGAENAILGLNGKVVDDRTLKVSIANTNEKATKKLTRPKVSKAAKLEMAAAKKESKIMQKKKKNNWLQDQGYMP